jgi:Rho termination factor, N-terminal domain
MADPSSLCSYPAARADKRLGFGARPAGSINQGRREEAMPQKAWSAKRERQYEHIKSGLKSRGRSEATAEEIAARTVNKERARSGEAKQRSRSSVRDLSSGRRGGLRSHRGSGGRTKEQLYNEAKDLGIKGRSRMTKSQLLAAVNRKSGRRSA